MTTGGGTTADSPRDMASPRRTLLSLLFTRKQGIRDWTKLRRNKRLAYYLEGSVNPVRKHYEKIKLFSITTAIGNSLKANIQSTRR